MSIKAIVRPWASQRQILRMISCSSGDLCEFFGVDALNRVHLEIRFVRPVRIEDTVTGGGELQAGAPNVYDVWVKNQKGEEVIRGTATLRAA